MSTLYISEFTHLAQDSDGNVLAAPKMPPIAEQALTFSTTAASSAFNDGTRFILIEANANCHIEVGKTPTATTSNMPLQANQKIFLGVTQGDKIAAVDA